MNSTLVEKYRPRSWDEVVGNDWIKEVLQRMIENDTTQHMLFVGRPGCGKTTMARIFASKYLKEKVDFSVDSYDYKELNASDERGIDVIRGRDVKKYCRTPSEVRGRKRILYLMEMDNLTLPAQRALRAIMENNQDNVIIIGDLNHLEAIKEDALLSRMVVFKFDPQPPNKLREYFLKIANGEGLMFESEELITDILNFAEYKGDFRRVVNDTLQKLLGIDRVVTKKDCAWIYRESYLYLIRDILKDRKIARREFFNFYRENHVDPVNFIRQLFIQLRDVAEMNYELAKAFAETEQRIKMGGDELIQLNYLLTAVEYYD